MICPKCGEKNPESYRFCGMCGAPLEVKQAAAPPAPAAPVPAAPVPAVPARTTPPSAPVAAARPPVRPAVRPEVRPAPTGPRPSLGGPSLQGFDPAVLEKIRARAFSGVEPHDEPERRRSSWGIVVAVLILLAGLGAAAWWHYSWPENPQDANQTPEATNSDAGSEKAPASDSSSGSAAKEPENPAAAATPTPAPAETPSVTRTEQPKPVEAAVPSAKAPAAKIQKRHEPAVVAPKPVRPQPQTVVAAKAPKPAPVPSSEGDALFRKGESFLYGRGAKENCAEAIKYLKLASDKSHVKARSTLGSMYATGHCVSRDLPSSYRWFALALRADPNNSVVEKDLSAVWNQMTPPERQLATKSQ